MKTIERLKSLDILLVCGLYGSGKNEFALRYFDNGLWNRISRNEMRKLMFEMTHFGRSWMSESFNEEVLIINPK
ncbi:MAG: hypothetical protein PF637_10405 [Spirochaetes bacterium]|jgi:predicted kinase|nr:hypothetical protein [Spirochaetota bacterium]